MLINNVETDNEFKWLTASMTFKLSASFFTDLSFNSTGPAEIDQHVSRSFF